MARPRKDYKILSCRIERTVYEQLDKFCETTGQPKTVAIERILGTYFNNYFAANKPVEYKINEESGFLAVASPHPPVYGK